MFSVLKYFFVTPDIYHWRTGIVTLEAFASTGHGNNADGLDATNLPPSCSHYVNHFSDH